MSKTDESVTKNLFQVVIFTLLALQGALEFPWVVAQ